jgi:hypothetical protein
MEQVYLFITKCGFYFSLQVLLETFFFWINVLTSYARYAQISVCDVNLKCLLFYYNIITVLSAAILQQQFPQ